MERALRTRLDALIVLCSGILGVAVTHLLLGQPSGPQLAFLALFPTAVVLLLAFLYVEYSSTPRDAGG